MTKPNILAILASTRQGRFGEKVFVWFRKIVEQRHDADFEFVDLRDWQLPYYDAPMTASQAEALYTDERLKAWVAKIHSGDGFIVVTPEYNHGYPAVLKSALDAVYQGWNDKPIAFVSYGGSAGGARVVEQLRLVAIELQMAPIRNAVTFPFASRMFDEKGNVVDPIPQKQVNAMLDQLVWWADALKQARMQHPLPSR